MMGRKMVRGSEARYASSYALALLGTSVLAGVPTLALAQQVPATQPSASAAAPSPAVQPAAAAPAAPQAEAAPAQNIQTIVVQGAQRLEPDTILSYIRLRPGQPYTQAAADQALKDLFATELFADVQVRNENGIVVIEVKENPVINRIILEGNKRIKDEKILPEIKLAPRQIFTRSKVRADVARIIELYKRQGRFAATVEPKMVMLEQNRVDIVFEITEGPKSKVRQINIIGNEQFSDGDLRSQMVTKQARLTRIFSSGTSYDPDRLAFDQQKLRQFYLTQGYADFRVVSAVAELTPDKEDFIITYVVEEGQRYKFGDVKVDSQLRDFDSDVLSRTLPMTKGDWYNAKLVEDTIERLNETAGAYGYAFAEVHPDYTRNKEDLTMDVKFNIDEAPRVYVERIDVNGNTLTQDKVIRREFRLSEGDAFNSYQVKRSSNRIKSLGYFQEKFEIEQKPGSAPDRIILEANVEEKPTGELQLSAGYSSIEKLIFQGSVRQNNFRGRGQTLGLSGSFSNYSKSAELSFTDPFVFDKNISLGADIYRRDYDSFNFSGDERNTTYQQSTTGFQVRAGVPLSEYMTGIVRYTISQDKVTLGPQYFRDIDGNGVEECDPLVAGRYLCDALGTWTSSIIGATLVHDTLDNRARPSAGHLVSLNADFAGLGGNVQYARLRLNAAQYFPLGGGFIFSLAGEGGAIQGFGKHGSAEEGVDDVRLTDRFYLGEPQLRGFDIRGVGPRVLRKPLVDADSNPATALTPSTDRKTWTDDSIGGKYYYLGRAEMEIPLGSGARELGLRPSIFVDVGSLWNITAPETQNCGPPDNPNGCFIQSKNAAGQLQYNQVTAVDANGNQTVVVVTNPVNPNPPSAEFANNTPNGSTLNFVEEFIGDTWKPRVAVGIGVNWNSPFGPFRIDFAHVLVKQKGDDTKTFTFNVGTQF
jgi:outer membrane protein insertion porin family